MKLDMDADCRKTLIACTSMVCVAVIVLYAVSQGHDGLFIGGGSAAIAGLGGYKLKATKG